MSDLSAGLILKSLPSALAPILEPHDAVIKLAYLVATLLFIYGIKGMTHPRSAVRGNQLSALGMLIALVATLFDRQIVSFEFIILGMVVGGVAGAIIARKVKMTAMPQMVALLTGFGGASSLLVAVAAILEVIESGGNPTNQMAIGAVCAGGIGAVTFMGSIGAFAKLADLIPERPLLIPGRHVINAMLTLVSVGLAIALIVSPEKTHLYWYLLISAGLLGIGTALPIAGSDMPVIITLLTSFSGMAACATGFVLKNYGLIIAGSIVGSVGLILNQVMCRAMNRTMWEVVFGAIESGGGGPSAEEVYAKVKSATAEEVAIILDGARRIVIVPGYGMAVAQAQFAVRDLADLLESKGAEVEYAIHPVAGRMPGHMNVLLAEANIPYNKMAEMEAVNPMFGETDAAIIIGANDIVNPLARTDPSSPISGMPILDVDRARNVIIIKRSLSPGFAGIPNPLFALPNSVMFFADGKKAVMDLITAVKEG